MIYRLFNFDMLRDRGEERYNTIITTTTGSWWHGGVWKARFQQSSSTHSGAGEKETLNINVVGKKGPLTTFPTLRGYRRPLWGLQVQSSKKRSLYSPGEDFPRRLAWACPQHLCQGSPFLLPLSVSRFIAGIELFRPRRATRSPLLLLLCCTLYRRLSGDHVCWTAIYTTLKYSLMFYQFPSSAQKQYPA